MRKDLYIFSGLGADERVFYKLDVSEYNTTYITWAPANKDEEIEQYASRIINQITSPKPILLGLSFGGMIATEVAKQIETEKVILVSSAKTKNEIPWYYRLLGKLRVHKLLPEYVLKRASFFTYWLFGVNSLQDKQLLRQILKDTDTNFLQWAIDNIVRWKNQTVLTNVLHIHGKQDRILPLTFVHTDIVIENGGHLMIITHADTINQLLSR